MFVQPLHKLCNCRQWSLVLHCLSLVAGVPAGGLGLGATESARIAEVTAADHSISVMLAAHQNAGLKVLPSCSCSFITLRMH